MVRQPAAAAGASQATATAAASAAWTNRSPACQQRLSRGGCRPQQASTSPPPSLNLPGHSTNPCLHSAASLTMSAVRPLTERERLKRGKILQAPRMTTDEHASAMPAPTRPSTVASFTAAPWVCTAGDGRRGGARQGRPVLRGRVPVNGRRLEGGAAAPTSHRSAPSCERITLGSVVR